MRSHAPRLGRIGQLLVAVTLLSAACASCSRDDDAEPLGDTADAYAVVVRWFVDNSAGADGSSDDNQIVYIEPLGDGITIGLETQAALVAATEDFADVRFIDDRTEAMDDGKVRAGVLLLALGSAITDGKMANVVCDQILGEAVVLSWTFDLEYGAEGWTLKSVPTPRT